MKGTLDFLEMETLQGWDALSSFGSLLLAILCVMFKSI